MKILGSKTQWWLWETRFLMISGQINSLHHRNQAIIQSHSCLKIIIFVKSQSLQQQLHQLVIWRVSGGMEPGDEEAGINHNNNSSTNNNNKNNRRGWKGQRTTTGEEKADEEPPPACKVSQWNKLMTTRDKQDIN